MSNTNKTSTDNHIRFLDSARGIAAIMVFVHHFMDMKYKGNLKSRYFELIFNGNEAVSFFFVLSGFILSYKYIVLRQPLNIYKFYISRFFRLWPSFAVIIIMMYAYVYMRDNNLKLSYAINKFTFEQNKFWEELLLIRFHNSVYYPGWTLTIEMIGSLFIPFFIIIAIKDARLIICLILVFLLGVGQNFFYSIHFLLGVLISCNYTKINKNNFKKYYWFKFRYIILVIAIFAWNFRFLSSIISFSPIYLYFAQLFGVDAFHYSGMASAIFIIAILYSKKLQKILEMKLFLYIGKISYSIYLVHILCAFYIYNYFEHLIPSKNSNIVVASMILGYCVLTLILASLMHYFIELPSIRLGKRITNKIKTSFIIENNTPILSSTKE